MHHSNQTPMVVYRECAERFPLLSAIEEYWNKVDQDFSIRITRSWFNRIQSAEDPLAKQVFPQPSELATVTDKATSSMEDPVGEQGKQIHPLLIQKHDDRILLLLSRHCHLHCRYCFRRTLPNAHEPTDAELRDAINVIQSLNVQEVILTGGDPLFSTDKRLEWVLEALSFVPTIRIHTRAPITFPERVSQSLCSILARHKNLWLIVHCNHVAELSENVISGLSLLQQASIPLLNQSVLLKGVNDSPESLVSLFQRLVELRVFPYYLHHTDRVKGAEDFYVSLDDGWNIYKRVAAKVSGIALPVYVIDLPDGSGKIPVERHIYSLEN